MSNYHPTLYMASISDHAYLAVKSRIEGDCLCWTGAYTDGYGMTSGRVEKMAHRLAYRTWVGPIPDGLELDHLCRNRGCIWPEHLEAVTKAVNIARGNGATARHGRQTHCIHGHPLSGENLRMEAETNGRRRRRCITCFRRTAREAQARYMARKRHALLGIIDGKLPR